MNKEELELVIQAIEKLGNAGQAAFTWWLICDLIIKNALGYLVSIIFISVSWTTIKSIVKTVSFGGRVLAAARKPTECSYEAESEERQEAIIYHIKTNFK